MNWPATLIVALGAGFVFMRLGAPLPWVLGPIAICLLGALFGVVEKPPRWVIESARAMLGFAVGAAFTPAAVAALPGYAPSLAMVPVFLIIACGVGYVFFRRIAKFDRPTAFYSSAPGGLQDMVVFGEAAGGNLRALALAHATRVLLIVYFLPFWIEGVMGEAIGARAPSSVAVTDMAAFDWLALFACCGFGYWAAKRLKLAGAGVVGPMIVSALVHATGLVETKTPAELMIGAQLVLGATIGCFFVGLTVREFFGSISFSAIYTAFLIALGGAFAWFAVAAVGAPPLAAVLAFAPGGQGEMNVIAFILGAEVAYVALMHLARVVCVILGAQIVFRWLDRKGGA